MRTHLAAAAATVFLAAGAQTDIPANEYLVTFDDGFAGPPALFDVDEYRGARGTAADYGEHTDEVLTELGRSPADIAELRRLGIVG